MKNLIILIIFLIVGILTFFISRFIYSIPFFYEHEKFSFYIILIISALIYFIILKIFYR